MPTPRVVVYLSALAVTFGSSACHVGRFVVRNFANITDHRFFPAAAVEVGDAPGVLATAQQRYGVDTLSISVNGERMRLDDYLDDETTTEAFLVVRGDSVVYERYFDGRDTSDISTTFSVTKSVTSLLIGIAVDEGHIDDVDDPVTRYLPELVEEHPYWQRLTLRHCLDMRSGLDYAESYSSPFAHMAKLYYGTNSGRQIRKLGFDAEPGTRKEYQSATTQVLGMVLERATGVPYADYLEEKVWQPMGMEHAATVSLDSEKHGVAKAYSGLNTTARDLAKIGMLYARGGRWRGRQIVSEDWVRASVTADTSNGNYQYQWYAATEDHRDEAGAVVYYDTEAAALAATAALSLEGARAWRSKRQEGKYYLSYLSGAFYAQGIMNQHIYVDPARDIVIVRQGRKWDSGYLTLYGALARRLGAEA